MCRRVPVDGVMSSRPSRAGPPLPACIRVPTVCEPGPPRHTHVAYLAAAAFWRFSRRRVTLLLCHDILSQRGERIPSAGANISRQGGSVSHSSGPDHTRAAPLGPPSALPPSRVEPSAGPRAGRAAHRTPLRVSIPASAHASLTWVGPGRQQRLPDCRRGRRQTDAFRKLSRPPPAPRQTTDRAPGSPAA